MDQPQKLSFGFSKISKKTVLLAPKQTETIDYIKCVEDNAVKSVVEQIILPKEPLVIPMPPGSTVRDRILDAIKAREVKSKGKNPADVPTVVENGNTNKPLTLDEMAAKELLENGQKVDEEKTSTAVITSSETDTAKRTQSTLDDYENMPVNDFGLAMLRGMGWDPKKGIGLNEKIVETVTPQVRPKGMGLGADKAMANRAQQLGSATEDLVMKKGSMVKVISGPHNNLYGKVEGFEELPGRIMVRLTLSNSLVSINEFMVLLVGLTEYNKNSKVMNMDTYVAALKDNEDTKETVRAKTETTRDDTKFHRRDKDRRSRSPVEKYDKYSKRPSEHSGKLKKPSDEKDRRSKVKSKPKYDSDSDSDDRKYKRRSPERRHKHSKKSKYKSDSSSDSERERRRSSKSKYKEHSKSRSHSTKHNSDSSPDRRYKKHNKSRR